VIGASPTSAVRYEPVSARTHTRARELLVLASVAAAVLWGIFLLDATSGTSRGRVSGLPIGTDFIQFYTLAHIGRDGRYDALGSFERFRAEQLRVLPDTADTPYPPVYPPQVAKALSPLAALPYFAAYLVWVGVTAGLYAGCVRLMARATPAFRPWPWQVAAIAAANPALWFVALHGQFSVVPLLALVGAWYALERRRPWLAGLALGILGVKPSLFVPAVALCVFAGEWRLAAGAVLGAASHYLAIVPWGGTVSLERYVGVTLTLLRSPDLVASNPPLMHSLRTFWSAWLPGGLATAAYGLSSVATLVYAAVAWRRMGTSLERIGLLGLVVVLVSPHLFSYDLLLLTPLIVASAAILTDSPARRLRRWTIASYLAPLWGLPVAAAGAQLSTLALVAWMRAAVNPTPPHGPANPPN
jgi:hypothetical protein